MGMGIGTKVDRRECLPVRQKKYYGEQSAKDFAPGQQKKKKHKNKH